MAFDSDRFRVYAAQLWDYLECVTFLNERGQDLLRSGSIPYLDALYQARLTDPTHTRISMIRERETRRVVGLALLKISYDWRRGVGDVEYVLVDEEFRAGHGMGRALMEHLLDQARAVRPRLAQLHLVCEPDRERARWLYRNLGFQLVDGSDRHFSLTLMC